MFLAYPTSEDGLSSIFDLVRITRLCVESCRRRLAISCEFYVPDANRFKANLLDKSREDSRIGTALAANIRPRDRAVDVRRRKWGINGGLS
jgi:hypothetical protein